MSSLMEVAGERLARVRGYRPGAPAAHDADKLSSNESALGPSARVRAAIAACSEQAGRYPTGAPLIRMLAHAHSLPEDAIVLTNGSDELCYLLAALFLGPGARVVLSDPGYQIDALVTHLHRAQVVTVPVRDGGHDLPAMAAAADGAALVWITTPHNPTGVAVDPAALERFLTAVSPDCLVALDEAYRHYLDVDRRPDVAGLLARHRNLIVMRTLSKAYALAGLRIGYGLGPVELMRALDSIRPPFNCNQAALAAAQVALSEAGWRDYGVTLVRREREKLHSHLDGLDIEHYRSDANFVTLRPPRCEALRHALAERGLIVRDGGDLGLQGWMRISVGAPPQMAILRSVLTEHMEAGR